jgi:ferredoxin-NADP reductase
MLNLIDNFLNKITMYRLVLYVLVVFAGIGIVFAFLGLLPFNGTHFVLEALFLIAICYYSNKLFAWVFRVPANVESNYITAFILFLIVNPPEKLNDLSYWGFLFWVAVIAMASKYILAIKRKHIFNPAALALVVTGFTLHLGASWWIGTLYMLPFVLIGTFLIIRKIQRFDLFLSFILVSLVTIMAMRGDSFSSAFTTAKQLLIYSPLFFFAAVMLTEPLTAPHQRNLRIIYGALVGFLFSPFVHIGTIYSTPELALLIGNIFSYLVSPKQKIAFVLVDKIKVADSTYDFIFSASEKLRFKAGQYLEWTLGHPKTDSRGNRRYFTVASAPTIDKVRLGVRFYPNGSTFKNALLALENGSTVMAGGLAGEFTLPKNSNKKLAFLAGGIGITPFRSMVEELAKQNEKRNIILLYSNRTQNDIAYKDFFDEIGPKIGLQTIHTLSDELHDSSWAGLRGMVTKDILIKEIPDYKERYFYISGTHGMVKAFEAMLKGLGISKNKIKVDFFPGYA